MRLLITGGAGFIGSNFIRYVLDKYSNYEIVNVDAFTYAGNIDNLATIKTSERYHCIKADISDADIVNSVFGGMFNQKPIDAIINFAAESHVDRSIDNPLSFSRTNVLGTHILLEKARQTGVQKFLQVSTDEVYGTLGESGHFTEDSPLLPNSPYSASKAGADCLVRSYHETYGLPVNITRCSNNYGAYQFPEKLIPLMVIRALRGEPLPVYGDGLNVRDWLHVEDHCSAIDLVLHHGRNGEVYNVGGRNERTNIDIVRTILKELGRSESQIQFVEDRLGHDRRYAIDASKIHAQLGWQAKYSFDVGLRETIQWYVSNAHWWERILSGEYRDNNRGFFDTDNPLHQ